VSISPDSLDVEADILAEAFHDLSQIHTRCFSSEYFALHANLKASPHRFENET
jgi:hypothetical protein